MADKDLVMVIDKPHFIVKLHQSLLEVDLKEGARKEIEDFVEKNRYLRGSLGALLQNAIPLDVSLKDIESVKMDEKGQVKIVVPHRKDLAIPLEEDEAKRLIDKLNELIPIEKQKEAQRLLEAAEAMRDEDIQRGRGEYTTEKTEKLQ
jgi:hypothetical protein